MATKSYTLSNGIVLIIAAINSHIVVYYSEGGVDKETTFKDMKEARKWIKIKFKEDL